MDDDARAWAAELAEMRERARPMPFVRARVRVDKFDANRLVDSIQDAVDREHDLVGAAEAVRQAIRHAQSVPLTDQVRIPASLASALASALRTAARPAR